MPYYGEDPRWRIVDNLQQLGYAITSGLQKRAQMKAQNTFLQNLVSQIQGGQEGSQPEQPPGEAAPQPPGTMEGWPTLNVGPNARAQSVLRQAPDIMGGLPASNAGPTAQPRIMPPQNTQLSAILSSLADPNVDPETKMQNLQTMSAIRQLIMPTQKLSKPFQGPDQYYAVNEYGKVVPLGVGVPKTETVKMHRWNEKEDAYDEAVFLESKADQKEQEGWTRGEIKFRTGQGLKAPLPTTDKGWTLSFDPKTQTNIAQKEVNGRVTREVYNPQKHGLQMRVGRAGGGGGASGGEGGGSAGGRVAGSDAEMKIVHQLVNGMIPLPSGFALRSPYWQKILALAVQEDPTFDASQYNVRLKTRQGFTTGKEANNIRSINTLVGHLDTLQKKAKALKNMPIQAWNWLSNTALTQSGDPRVVEFNNAATAVETEIASVFKGGGSAATNQEIKQWRQNLNSSQSPAQLQKGIETAIELMSSRLNQLQNQYKVGMGRDKDYSFLSPKARAILTKMGYDVEELDPVAPSGKTTEANKTSYSNMSNEEILRALEK